MSLLITRMIPVLIAYRPNHSAPRSRRLHPLPRLRRPVPPIRRLLVRLLVRPLVHLTVLRDAFAPLALQGTPALQGQQVLPVL